MKSRVNKLATMILLVACIVIPAFAIKALATGTGTQTLSGDVTGIQYTAEDAKKYLEKPAYTTVSGTTIKVGDTTKEKHNANSDRIPQPNATNASDYLFAGWYKTYDEATKTFGEPIRNMEDIGTEPVYAKFLTKKVLGVKAQIKAQLRDDEVNAKDVDTGFRFLTSIDGFQYNAIGIEVSYTNGNNETVTSTNENVSKVYDHLYVLDTYKGTLEQNGKPVTAKDTFGCDKSKYFKAYTITDVPWQAYQYEFTVRPYWITLDGTEVYGDVQVKTVEQGCIRQEVWVANKSATQQEAGISNTKDVCCYGSKEWPYDSLDYAFHMTNMANNANIKADNVKIHVISDLVADEQATLNNPYGINVTVDAKKSTAATEAVATAAATDWENGDYYTITTSKEVSSFAIRQKTGTVTFKEMNIAHGANMAFRMGEYEGNDKDAYVSTENVLTTNFENITLTTDTSYQFGLIQYNGFQKYDANFANVDVKWTADNEVTKDGDEIKYASVVRTGGENTGNSTNRIVNLTMTDCNVDTSAANHREGIGFSNSKLDKGTITLNNTNIKTKNAYPLDMRTFTLTQTGTTILDSDNAYFDATPICDREKGVVSIGDTPYLSLFDALSETNNGKHGPDVTINVNYDCAFGFTDTLVANKYEFNTQENLNLVINGNRHTLTTHRTENLDPEKNESSTEITLALPNTSLKFQDVLIDHNTAGRLIQVSETAKDFNLEMQGVTIQAYDDKLNNAYHYGLINLRSSGTVDMDTVNIDMGIAESLIVDDEHTGVIRVGNETDIEKVKISLADCTIDTSDALNRPSISVQEMAHVNIELTGENILNTKESIKPIRVYGIATVDGTGTTTVNSVDGTAENLYGKVNSGEVGEPNVVTSLHDFKYPTLNTAMNDVNNSTNEEITLTLCKDITLENPVYVNNPGKTIIVDGKKDAETNYKVTTPIGNLHAIHVQQTTGQVTFQNMDIAHNAGEMVFRVGEFENAIQTNDQLNFNLKNVYVDASAEYQYGLLQFNGYQTYNADLNNVKFIWKTTQTASGDADSAEKAAAIRTGASSTEYIRTVNLKMTDCIIDTQYAEGTRGLGLGTTNDVGKIELLNTSIISNNNYPIYTRDFDITYDDATSLKANHPYYNGAPIYSSKRGVAKVVNGTEIPCMTFKEALTKAKASDGPVRIELLQNCVIGVNGANQTDDYIFDEDAQDITIIGNGKTLTTEGTEAGIKLDIQASNVKFAIHNATIKHNATDRFLQVQEGQKNSDITLNGVNIIAEGKETATAYQYGLINYQGSGKITIDATTMNIDITDAIDNNTYPGVIRTGDAGKSNKVKVEMTGSTIDTTGAANRPAIYITSGTTGDMDIVTSTLSTSTDKPIAVDGNTCLTSDVSVSYGGSGTVSDAGADLNGFSYATLDDALAAANTEGGSATIVLVKEASLAAHTLTKEGLNLTIDGNGKTITTPNTAGTTPSLNLAANGVELTIKNATITHQSKERLLQVGRQSDGATQYTGCEITLDNTTINVTEIDTLQEYRVAVINLRSSATLTMQNNSSINMPSNATAQANASVIRIGNSGDDITVDITMDNSTIDAANATNISAIRINNSSIVNIWLNKAELKTQNYAPIFVDTSATLNIKTLSSDTTWSQNGEQTEKIYNTGSGTVTEPETTN